jgi:hypothetical protein
MKICATRDGDDYNGVDVCREDELESHPPKSPFCTPWIKDLIMDIIGECPLATNQTLCRFLSLYGKPYAITDSIIQAARTQARSEIFGDPTENCKYAGHVKNALESKGHIVKLRFTNQKETIQNVERIVLSDEILRLKDFDGSTLEPHEQRQFVEKWKEEQEELLVGQLGSKNDGFEFLNGIFFMPSFAQKTVPHLKDVFMADACHLHFSKYTLFSCYDITANANMSPVAFAILCGNESGYAWKQFWEFIVQVHPSINREQVTVITDQDKGQMNAIAHFMDKAGHFHCSWHRRQNIIKKCGGGSGKTPYSALWMYNKQQSCQLQVE